MRTPIDNICDRIRDRRSSWYICDIDVFWFGHKSLGKKTLLNVQEPIDLKLPRYAKTSNKYLNLISKDVDLKGHWLRLDDKNAVCLAPPGAYKDYLFGYKWICDDEFINNSCIFRGLYSTKTEHWFRLVRTFGRFV